MNATGYLRVWKVEEKKNIVVADLGDSRKTKDGDYENWTWFRSAFVGDAKDKASNLSERDLINVTGGQISMRKADDGKYYPNLVIFDFEEVDGKASGGGESKSEGKSKSAGSGKKKTAKKSAPEPEPELDDDDDDDDDEEEELPF